MRRDPIGNAQWISVQTVSAVIDVTFSAGAKKRNPALASGNPRS
jgi:hypothetical protein